jgi:hypothetical protein
MAEVTHNSRSFGPVLQRGNHLFPDSAKSFGRVEL